MSSAKYSGARVLAPLHIVVFGVWSAPFRRRIVAVRWWLEVCTYSHRAMSTNLVDIRSAPFRRHNRGCFRAPIRAPELRIIKPRVSRNKSCNHSVIQAIERIWNVGPSSIERPPVWILAPTLRLRVAWPRRRLPLQTGPERGVGESRSRPGVKF